MSEPAEAFCWCCARWGLPVPATTANRTCDRCASSSPSACEKRHMAQALTLAKDTP